MLILNYNFESGIVLKYKKLWVDVNPNLEFWILNFELIY
jgi:hypothetical protein